MSDAIGFGAMLFGPEHALKIAADSVENHAKSTDMAVGIILGVRSSIEEYQRLFSPPISQPNDQAPTKEIEEKKEPSKARERVGGLARA
jgi:hypothetical protein